jgi:hypothetical protein
VGFSLPQSAGLDFFSQLISFGENWVLNSSPPLVLSVAIPFGSTGSSPRISVMNSQGATNGLGNRTLLCPLYCKTDLEDE